MLYAALLIQKSRLAGDQFCLQVHFVPLCDSYFKVHMIKDIGWDSSPHVMNTCF
jgi:hypothetical protein